MKNLWIMTIVLTSFALLVIVKSDEEKSFHPFFRSERVIKLKNFQTVRQSLSTQDAELLELWESMLTGRSAPVSKWIKQQYKTLGLNHLFTPSGFHLSAVMMPFMKWLNKKWKFGLLLTISLGLLFINGQGALKRMALIKLNQNIFNQKTGFIIALILDVLFGSFTNSPLSFCYSFLFLGIIYSRSTFLFLWFFFAQSLIAYFNGELISPLIMLLSPILNLAFALAMPFLFLLAFPLWHWQVLIGLKILTCLQWLVQLSAKMITYVPCWEIHVGVLMCFGFIYFNKKRCLVATLCFLSFTLNIDQGNTPTFGKYDFIPQGKVIKIISNDKGETVYWSDGRCKRELIRGVWWEKCSPRKRRSTYKKA